MNNGISEKVCFGFLFYDYIPYKGDMNTHVPVDARAVQTDVDAKRNRSPCWIFGGAIKTHLSRVG
jgi:hypothetical protein